MHFFVKNSLISLFAMVFSVSVFAENTNTISRVAGYWQTIDDKTQKPSAVIEVKRMNGLYAGKIAKIYLENNQKTTDICKHCEGDQKDQPMLGLTIIKDMQCTATMCENGTILDPRDGSLYHATMKLMGEDGSQLKVRGYVGLPIFGKSVVWNRVARLN